MDQYGWIIALGGLILTALGIYAGWVARIMKGENAADAAKEAKSAVDKVSADLAAYKAEAASRFATIEMVEKTEDRLNDAVRSVGEAINRLADRIDRLIEQRPTAPRTRAVKS